MPEKRADSISEPHAVYRQSEPRTTLAVERLISSRRLKPATVDLLELGRPPDERHEISISEALSEQRSKNAFLEAGTVFDAAVQADTDVAVEPSAPFALRLGESGPKVQIEILYDEIETEGKQKILPLRITSCGQDLDSASVVTLNEADISPIPVVLGARSEAGDCVDTRATIDLEKLAKSFKKGINRFEVEAAGTRTEVLLEIEI